MAQGKPVRRPRPYSRRDSVVAPIRADSAQEEVVGFCLFFGGESPQDFLRDGMCVRTKDSSGGLGLSTWATGDAIHEGRETGVGVTECSLDLVSLGSLLGTLRVGPGGRKAPGSLIHTPRTLEGPGLTTKALPEDEELTIVVEESPVSFPHGEEAVRPCLKQEAGARPRLIQHSCWASPEKLP